jgi:hypothetical protein
MYKVNEVMIRIEESIQRRKNGHVIDPYEVSGIIKVLTNKSKIIQTWLIRNMPELFEKS